MSNFDQSNDYSFNPGITFPSEWDHIVIFENDELIYGLPQGTTPVPPEITPTPTPQPTQVPSITSMPISWGRSIHVYDSTGDLPVAGAVVIASAITADVEVTDANGDCSVGVTTYDTRSVMINVSAAGYQPYERGFGGMPSINQIQIPLEPGSLTPTPEPAIEPTVPGTPVPATDKGDANGDGYVDIIDALLIAQYYVGLPVSINATLADVNNDGSVNIIDALLIAQYYVGLITSFP